MHVSILGDETGHGALARVGSALGSSRSTSFQHPHSGGASVVQLREENTAALDDGSTRAAVTTVRSRGVGCV